MNQPFYARFARPVVALFILLTPLVLFGAVMAALSNSNDVRNWLPEDYAETRNYAWFKQHFGLEEFVLATWPGCDLDSPQLEEFANRVLPDEGEPQATERRRLFSQVVTGTRLVDELMAPPASLSRGQAVKRLRGSLVGGDGEQTCAIVTPTELGKARIQEMLEAIYAAAEECGLQRQDVRLGGPPVINGAIDMEGARTLSRLGGLSGLVALIVSWYCFRSVRLTLLVFATGMFCAAASLALLWLTGIPMNAILLMMPPLVYVAVMSGAIHLVNYYLEALPEVGPQRAPARAVTHARLPLVLAATTTAVGLLSLCYSELVPIRQFGIYSACGVVIGTATLLLFLPSALQIFPVSRQSTPSAGAGEAHDDGLMTLSRGWLAFADFVVRHRRSVTLTCLAAVVAGGIGLSRLQTTIKVEKFFASGSQVLDDYDWIQTRLGGLVPMEVVLRVRDDSTLRLIDQVRLVDILQGRLMQLPEVSSTQSAATFSPPPAAQGVIGRLAVNRWLRNALNELADTGYFRDNGGEKLWRISIRIPTADDIDFTEFVDDIRGQIEPVLTQLKAKGTIGISAEYTGMVPVFNKAQHSLLDGMLFGFSTDLVLIFLAMIVLLRHWSVGAIILATSLFPATLIFGAMSWLGIPVDVGSVMTPSIALGVTVDDVAHFLLWFRRGVSQGMSQSQAVKLAYRGCAKPMYQSWAVIGLGLSVFALSTFVPALRFGVLMIALLSLGLVGNLVLMPALLAGPLGNLFARNIRRSTVVDVSHTASDTSSELTAAAGN
jgi:uncharacterized protein